MHGLAPGLNVGEQRHDGLAQRGKKRITGRWSGPSRTGQARPHTGRGREQNNAQPGGQPRSFQIRRKQAEIIRALALTQTGMLWLQSLVKAAYSSAGIFAISSYWRCSWRTSACSLLGLGLGGSLLQQGSGVCVDKQLKAGAAQHLAGLGRPSALPSGATVSASKSTVLSA